MMRISKYKRNSPIIGKSDICAESVNIMIDYDSS